MSINSLWYHLLTIKINVFHSRFVSNRYMLKASLGQDVEWGYAFDVHLNAFFPPLVILHIIQLFFYHGKFSNIWTSIISVLCWNRSLEISIKMCCVKTVYDLKTPIHGAAAKSTWNASHSWLLGDDEGTPVVSYYRTIFICLPLNWLKKRSNFEP